LFFWNNRIWGSLGHHCYVKSDEWREKKRVKG
jgi:hypothetical protein